MRLTDRGKTVLAFGTLSIAIVAFEVALLATSEPLPAAGPVAAVLDRGLEAIRSGSHGAPGISVAIVRDGKIAYTFANGWANVTTRAKVTPDTRFRAGSITKMVTALCVMQLIEAGRMNLDAPVATYLPSAPHAAEISVRQLLSHTSGLPNISAMALSTGLAADSTTPQRMLGPLAAQPLDFAPGARYAYSDSNYVVLAQIVEALEGRPLADVARERIFVPAAMTQSSFAAGPASASLATGYDDPAGSKPTAAFDESWLYGAGDLVTTAPDLARFDIALMDGKLVTPQSLALMQRPLEATDDAGISSGLGFMTDRIGTKLVAGHHGGVPGFEADDEMIVNDRFAIVALSNSTTFDASGVDRLVVAMLLPTDFALGEAAAMRNVANRRTEIDPTIDARFRAFLSGVSNGSLDRTTLTVRMDEALTPVAVARLATELPKASTLREVTLVERSKEADYDVYILRATYAATKQNYEIMFDPHGRIAGFSLR